MKHAVAFIDGSGNSERIQACAVTLDMGGILYEEAQLLPPNTTNNVGEYSGLLLCLRLARRLGVEVLQIHSDSKLIVNQTLGKWKCQEPELQKLLLSARREGAPFHSLTISWVPREKNKRADKLCREAIKRAKSNPFIRKHFVVT
jgi:ribonuclease HI